MDAIDRQLLDLISANARLPLKTLAAHVGLARSSVRERLARLETGGVIRRYTVELAIENGTKITRTVVENHRRSRDYVRQTFGA